MRLLCLPFYQSWGQDAISGKKRRAGQVFRRNLSAAYALVPPGQHTGCKDGDH